MSNVIPLRASDDLRAELAWQATLEKLMLEARQIGYVLEGNSSITTAIEMWWRQWSGLRLVAAGTADPAQRAKSEERLAEREAAMARLIEQAQSGGRLHG